MKSCNFIKSDPSPFFWVRSGSGQSEHPIIFFYQFQIQPLCASTLDPNNFNWHFTIDISIESFFTVDISQG